VLLLYFIWTPLQPSVSLRKGHRIQRRGEPHSPKFQRDEGNRSPGFTRLSGCPE
jgi:hypothetical protein